jgi:hypothetical protein
MKKHLSPPDHPGLAEWKLRRAIADCARACRRCARDAHAIPATEFRARQRAQKRAMEEALSFARLAAKLGEALAGMHKPAHVTTIEYWKNGTLMRVRTRRRGGPSIFSVRIKAPDSAPHMAASPAAPAEDPQPQASAPKQRKRGGQPGNANRLGHGRYARPRLAEHARTKRQARAALTLLANMRKAHKALQDKQKRVRAAQETSTVAKTAEPSAHDVSLTTGHRRLTHPPWQRRRAMAEPRITRGPCAQPGRHSGSLRPSSCSNS